MEILRQGHPLRTQSLCKVTMKSALMMVATGNLRDARDSIAQATTRSWRRVKEEAQSSATKEAQLTSQMISGNKNTTFFNACNMPELAPSTKPSLEPCKDKEEGGDKLTCWTSVRATGVRVQKSES